MNERENWLRAVEFRTPQWIPCSVGISPLTWNVHREGLRTIVLEHPRIFPRYDAANADFYDEMPPVYRQGERYTDNWGCTWYNIQGGLEGQVGRYIKPLFMTLFQTCRQAGVHVALSSDGCLLEIVDDLIECGVSVHDPQLRANTLQGIARAYKGKLCANVDLDRQSLPFVTPQEIREQIKEVVDSMALPEGGLMVLAAVYGKDVPLGNIAAICEAMEDYCF